MAVMLDTNIARRRRDREDLTVEIPAPSELLDRVRALPAAAPLLRRLPEEPAVYLVGGAVRDLLLGREPRELDLVVEGDPRTRRRLTRRDAPAARSVQDRIGAARGLSL